MIRWDWREAGLAMADEQLFDDLPKQERPQAEVSGGVRLRVPERSQIGMQVAALDDLISEDHPVRSVWAFVEGLEIGALYDSIKSREGGVGRAAADPKVLLALWIYATAEGVGSARHLERLAEREVAFRWLAGGVAVNYHGLADFRVDHVDVLDRLLTQSVTALVSEGLVSLRDIAVDGTKIRANASRSSFKQRKTLQGIEAAVGDSEHRVTAGFF